MNAMEHGNATSRTSRCEIAVAASEAPLSRADHRPGRRARSATRRAPDLDAKLAGQQTPRGWGLFLIENMVDEVRESPSDGAPHASSWSCTWKEADDERHA